MSGVNKAIVVGNLGADPEYRSVGEGGVCTFRVATSRAYKNRDGQRVEEVEWHRISVWGAQAEVCNKYLAKGRQVYVEGRIKTSSYEKDGITRYSTEIVAERVQFLGKKDDMQSDTQSDSSEVDF